MIYNYYFDVEIKLLFSYYYMVNVLLNNKNRLYVISCLVSCDSVPRRSWPLFKARDILQSLIHDFSFHGAEETE